MPGAPSTVLILALLACRGDVELEPGDRDGDSAPATPSSPSDTVDTDETTWSPGEATDTSRGPATCESWCACIVATCGFFEQVEDVASCVIRCDEVVLTTQEELDCWSAYCDYAATLPEDERRHSCEHAVGLFGLDECG